MRRNAVLLMAYGSPDSLDDVAAYFTHIRGGRRPSEEAIADLRARYARVGGRTPLLPLTQQLAARVQQGLGADFAVYVGMKHWRPFIGDVVADIAREGADRLIAVPLAPHYSMMSTEGYRRAVVDALGAAGPLAGRLDFVERWADRADFRRMIADRVRAALEAFEPEARRQVRLVFTAHSLPQRILQLGDPYPEELRQSAAGIADLLGNTDWELAYQSAGHTGEPWLGPDIVDVLDRLAAEGRRHVLVVPFGFTCEHLEVLYDIDVEAREAAARLGVELRRIAMPNADKDFADLLVRLIRERCPAGG